MLPSLKIRPLFSVKRSLHEADFLAAGVIYGSGREYASVKARAAPLFAATTAARRCPPGQRLIKQSFKPH